MTKQQVSILRVLNDGNALTRKQIAETIYGEGCDQARIYNALEKLVEEGTVIKRGVRPSYYSVSAEVNLQEPEATTEKTREFHVVSLSEDALRAAYHAVLNDPTYGTELKLVERVLNNPLFSRNTDVDIVAMKIALIDVTNSTHLHQYKSQINLQELAEFIVKKIPDFDERVSRRDDALVEELARCNGKINLFSFASKYCFYHNTLIYGRDDYAKYDGIVRNCLPRYLEQIKIVLNGRRVTPNTLNNMRKRFDYKSFNDLIDAALASIQMDHKKAMFDYLMWYYNRTT